MQAAVPPDKASDLETPAVNTKQCWGGQLQLDGDVSCTPGFIPGKLHFKSKFCDNCRDSILVPLAHVRALSAELAACFVNKRSEGFWNSAPKSVGGGQYRILNNTAGSTGPWIAVFRDQPPNFNWPSVPEHWVTDDGYVRLCVAKGTLVPAKTLRCGHVQASSKRSISNVEKGMVPNFPFPVRPSPPSRLPSSSTDLVSYSSDEQLPQLQVDGDHLEFRPSSVPAAAEQGSLATAEQDAEAMEAQLQHVLFGSSRSEDMDVGALGGPPLWEDQSGPPGGFATKPPGESLPTSLRSELDEDFANALLAASNGELGADVTSSDEGYHATCVAGESLSLDIQYDDLGNYRTSPKAVTSAEMRSLRKQGAAPTPQLIKGFAPAEEEATEEPEVATCWGAQLHFNGDANCIPNFVPGKLHFKNKFCANCKEGILVPLAHVRGVSAELAACFINKRSEGFWNNAPKSMGGGQYRILNNTAGSTGPRLALFRDEPPEFQWLPVPEHWITDDGCVRLCVAKGTLVPSKTLRCGYSPPAGGQATYKRRISRVAPTDSPSSCRPTQVPALSSLPDRPSSAAYARHLAAGGGQDIAHMSLQHAQRQVNPVGTSTVSPQSTFQSSRYHGVQGDNTEEYNSKLREYKAQLQALQKLQAQLMTMHGELGSEMQGGLPGGFEASPNTAVPASAPNAAPGLDIAVGMTGEEAAGIDAQKQLALFGAAVGVDSALFGPASPLPTRPWPRSSLPRSSLGGGAVAIPAPAPDKYNTPDGYTPEEFANALLEGDASTDEFGIDMASAIETWKANQAAGGGVANESLDVSRASTVCQGLQGLGLEREQMLAEELEQVEKLLPNALSSSTARSPPIPEGATEYDW